MLLVNRRRRERDSAGRNPRVRGGRGQWAGQGLWRTQATEGGGDIVGRVPLKGVARVNARDGRGCGACVSRELWMGYKAERPTQRPGHVRARVGAGSEGLGRVRDVTEEARADTVRGPLVREGRVRGRAADGAEQARGRVQDAGLKDGEELLEGLGGEARSAVRECSESRGVKQRR